MPNNIETPPDKTPSFFQHLRDNLRDVLLFIFLGIGFAILSDVTVSLSTRFGFSAYIPSIGNYLQGISRFVAANACAAVIGIYAWKPLMKFGVDEFDEGWKRLGIQQRTILYIAVILVEGVIAALCFSA